jgi:nitrate/nitrite transporter NarK
MILRLAGAQSISEIGWLSAVPYCFGIAGAVVIARSSDRFEERRWHVAVSLCLAAIALGATTLTLAFLANTLLLLSVGAFFLFGAGILFWTIPPTYLRKEDAATGIAMVSSIGAVGGFISPSVLGWMKSQTGRLDAGIGLICLIMTGAAIAVAWVVPGKLDNRPSRHLDS